MNIYKVGVIGCGRIASLMEQDEHRDKPTSHAGCYDLIERTQIVATADQDEESGLILRARFVEEKTVLAVAHSLHLSPDQLNRRQRQPRVEGVPGTAA